jgi:hypothetical protein
MGDLSMNSSSSSIEIYFQTKLSDLNWVREWANALKSWKTFKKRYFTRESNSGAVSDK